jgi:hypothetical protein
VVEESDEINLSYEDDEDHVETVYSDPDSQYDDQQFPYYRR